VPRVPTGRSVISRLRQITLLLASSENYLHGFADPKTATLASQSGPAPARKTLCPTCEGVGRTKGSGKCGACWLERGSHGCEQCSTCHGKGKAFVDDYTGAVVESLDESLKTQATGRSRKRTIEPKGLDDKIHAVAAAHHERNKSGSYNALDAAMARLRHHDEVAHALLKAHYVLNRWGIPSDLLQPIHLENGRPKPNVKVALLPLEHELACLRGLKRLDEWMPRFINLPREVLVQELSNEGVSIREQSRRLGISREKIRKAQRRAA
jgi:hypothetical protein